MVGLSVVLENQKSSTNSGGVNYHKKNPQIINKTTMLITNQNSISSNKSFPSLSPRTSFSHVSFPSPAFLEKCLLCKQKLLPGKDIYMYKGDRAFCSVECRCRQIFMDEEETLKKDNCSLAAMKPASSSSSSSSSFSAGNSHHRKGTRNRAGGFAY